ncbi:MAG: Ig-like domain-containing protein [Candidatus Cyclobacteriaceae bacterium M3_2C_046]
MKLLHSFCKIYNILLRLFWLSFIWVLLPHNYGLYAAPGDILWQETFDLFDGTSEDNDATAWTTAGTPTGHWQVRSSYFEGEDLDGEMIWSSEVIDISDYEDVSASVDILSVTSAEFEPDDYLNIYYKLNDGPEILFEQYGAQTGGFEARTSDLGCGAGFSGNTIQIIIRARNSTNKETYRFDNVTIYVKTNKLFAIKDGDWSDPTTWSNTAGGTSCDCIPDCASQVEINGFQVNLDESGIAKSVNIKNSGSLTWTKNNLSLNLHNTASLNIEDGSKIDHNGYNLAELIFTGTGNINLAVDDITNGIKLTNLKIYSYGTHTIGGMGKINLNQDLQVSNSSQIDINISDLSVNQSLHFLHDNIQLNLSGSATIGQIIFEASNCVLDNQGLLQIDQNILIPSDSYHTNRLRNSNQMQFQDLNTNNGDIMIENRGNLSLGNVLEAGGNTSFYNYDTLYYQGTDHDLDFKLYSSFNGNYINYNGTDQKIITPEDNYYDLELSQQGIKSTLSALNITHDFYITGNAQMDASGPSHDLIIGDDFLSYSNSADPFLPGSNHVTLRSNDRKHSIHSEHGIRFFDLTIDSDDKMEIDQKKVIILNHFSFVKGIVVTEEDGVLVISDDATITGYGNQHYVDGKLEKIGDDAFEFPLGNNNKYHPMAISAPNTSTDSYLAQYFNKKPHNINSKEAEINKVSNCSYWEVERTSGSTPVEVTLNWRNTCDIVSLACVNIVRWNGSKWIKEGNHNISGDSNVGSVTSDTQLNSLGLFSFGSINYSPVAVDDQFEIGEDAVLHGTLFDNDTEPLGIDLVFSQLTQDVSSGVLNIETNGSLTYTPQTNINGTIHFEYEVCNDHPYPKCDQASVDIKINPINDAPGFSSGGDLMVNEDHGLYSNSWATSINDGDPEIDQDLVFSITIDKHDLFEQLPSLDQDGTLQFKPKSDSSGTANIEVVLSDNGTSVLPDQNQSAPVSFKINVLPVNDAPVASDKTYTTDEDKLLTVEVSTGLLQDATDLDGDELTALLVTDPDHGTVTLNSEGDFTYIPSANYNGSDSFTYQVHDGTTDSEIATVTLTVNAINDAPVASDKTYTTDEDKLLTVEVGTGLLQDATDLDGDELTAVLVTDPDHGTVTLNSEGDFTYTPSANYNGSDSFTYQVHDGTLNSEIATVNITVKPINGTPIAKTDQYQIDEDNVLIVEQANSLLKNDMDEDQDQLTAKLIEDVSHGSLSLNADGSFTYIPEADFHGQDEFTYQAWDQITHSDPVVVQLIVYADNDIPVARGDEYKTNEDHILSIPLSEGILINDTDVEKGQLTAVLTRDVVHGTLMLNADGGFTYEPEKNYFGPDSFSYKANDGSESSNEVIVKLDVLSVNDYPLAADDAYHTMEDQVLKNTKSILNNDKDLDQDEITATLVKDVSHGTLIFQANGNFEYQPEPDYNGEDYFTYQASDQVSHSEPARVTIRIAPVNDVPIAKQDAYQTKQATTLEISSPGIISNDSDKENDKLFVVLVEDVRYGNLVLKEDGGFSYTPDEEFQGNDVFTYQTSDGQVLSEVVQVVIQVQATNDQPLTIDDHFSIEEDQLLQSSVLNNDQNLQKTTVSLKSNPARGKLTWNQNGTFEYQPNPDFFGQDQFSYQVCTETDQCYTAQVTIKVQSVNDAPLLKDDQVVIFIDTFAKGNVLLNDLDPENDHLYLRSRPLVAPEHGKITLYEDGAYHYQPVEGFTGTDKVHLEVCDDGHPNACAQSILKIKVEFDNAKPVAEDFLAEVEENQKLEVCLTASDQENDPLFIRNIINYPQHGNLSDQDQLCFSYNPDPEYLGQEVFQLEVCDQYGCDTVNVFIDVLKAPVKIYEAFSPNNDDLNDYWVIDGIQHFQDNEVIVFNRNGSPVFKMKGYNNHDKVWKGESNTSFTIGKNELPNGTYYYLINLGDGEALRKGFVVLNR